MLVVQSSGRFCGLVNGIVKIKRMLGAGYNCAGYGEVMTCLSLLAKYIKSKRCWCPLGCCEKIPTVVSDLEALRDEDIEQS